MASLGRDSVTRRDESRAVTGLAVAGGMRDTRDNNPIGVVTLSRPPRPRLSERLLLMEAILFALLHQATPDEAIPFVARRLASRAPGFTEGEIVARLGAPLVETRT